MADVVLARVVTGVAVTAGLMLVPAVAFGATTLGGLPPTLGSITVFDCVAGSYAQTGTDTTSPLYRVPGAGVITSWRNSAGSPGEAQERLKVVRPSTAAADVFRIIGASAYATPVVRGSAPIATRIPVLSGDVIGLGVAPPSAALVEHVPKCTWNASSFPPPAADLFRQRTPIDEDPDPATDRLWNAGSTNARLSVSATLELDADGDGFGDETQDQCFTDPSTQGPCPSPSVKGVAQVGQTLTGILAGAPINPSIQWLRCDSTGANCVAAIGATASTYIVAPGDVSDTLRLRKTASNASGTQTSESAQTAVVTAPVVTLPPVLVPPVLSRVSQSARKWVEGNARARLTRKRKRKLPVGTTFTFALNETSSIKFSFTEQASGRKLNGRCVSQTRTNALKPKCLRDVTAGTLAFTGHRGLNTTAFQGRITRSRTLKPGRCTLVIVASAAGQASMPAKLTFTIVRQ